MDLKVALLNLLERATLFSNTPYEVRLALWPLPEGGDRLQWSCLVLEPSSQSEMAFGFGATPEIAIAKAAFQIEMWLCGLRPRKIAMA